MSQIVYHVVEHDGGYAYKLGDVFSETFPTHAAALKAARRVAAEQGVPGSNEVIRYQDVRGVWHDETARGNDRPTASVVDG